MAKKKRPYLALLRGVNVGGHHKLPMAELRAALSESPLGEVKTYIQSGNVLCLSSLTASGVERQLAKTLEESFSFKVPVLVRDADQWRTLLGANPFAEQAQAAPNRVQVGIAKAPLAADAAEALQAMATRGEEVVAAGEALWMHYPAGIADTKLTPARLDRCAGSPVTTRNWRTALKLQEILHGLSAP
ncbi:MAG: DUF1697 domain-containing protein [Pseudomonadota bacterium]